MNPLDLRGPQFLLFYLVYGAAVLALLALWRRYAEAGGGPRVRLSDPYLIAHLRGGRDEALRVAAASLVDRGLLEVRGDGLVTREGVTADAVRRPIEKEIVTQFAGEQAAWRLFDASAAGAATREFERTLVEGGLLAGDEQRRQRRGRTLLGAVLLLGMAFVKIVVALSRGRTNVLFLVVLAAGFTLAAVWLSDPRRTAKGDALLGDLRTLFAGLRARAASLRRGGATSEVALLTAVFGLGALPPAVWADVRALLGQAGAGSRRTLAAGAASGDASAEVFTPYDPLSLSGSGSSCASAASCGGGGCGSGGGCGGCGS
jgi:uncharacterized protein (TIGR04222 family)